MEMFTDLRQFEYAKVENYVFFSSRFILFIIHLNSFMYWPRKGVDSFPVDISAIEIVIAFWTVFVYRIRDKCFGQREDNTNCNFRTA